MIARIWRGWTSIADTAAYAAYVAQTGLVSYQATPGNCGAWILHRRDGDRTEFITFSLWESEDSIRHFAGEDITRAVFYPEDDRYLVAREEYVQHYDVA